jgi:uncharacterized repeat protein (TIGR01451 family)
MLDGCAPGTAPKIRECLMRASRRLLLVIVAASTSVVGFAPMFDRSGVLDATAAYAATSIAPPIVRDPVLFDVSEPFADLDPVRPPVGRLIPKHGYIPRPDIGAQPADPVRQAQAPSGGAMPAPNLTFEGQRDADNFPFLVEPPDPVIDVGPNHVVQMVNITLAVYDKQGNLLLGPVNNNTFWQDFGVGEGDLATPACATSNVGDPIVQYDGLADRWMISQFAFAGGAAFQPVGPYYECIAVSRTGDPLGRWARYEYKISETLLDDYPHFGVWPDAYYMSINQFDETQLFEYAGPGAVAFERDRMLAGESARMVYFDLSGTLGPRFGGQLPADLDGQALPPAGAPNPFVEADDDVAGFATDRLSVFDFHVDWSNPAASTFSGPSTIDVAAFDSVFPCGDADGDGAARNCIPEAEGPGLDAISDRIMYRLAYRSFGGYEVMVANHTVDVNDPEGHAGIRWYELRRSAGAAWGIHQQGTFAPDARHRWMGSIAMDKAGNIAVGYSLSSAAMHPAIAYAGRLAGDPAGQLGQGEALMFEGTGSQQADAGGRWGDYTSLHLDPVNDCTFWYTNEYYEVTGSFDWHTRIGSFTFPSCLGSGGDVGVLASATPPPIRVGDRITYTLRVTNNGPDGTTGVNLVDTLPTQASLISASSTKGKCSGVSTVTCKIGTLARGAGATVTIAVRAPAVPATLVNTATVSSQKRDPNPDNNVATVVLDVIDTCAPPGVLVADDTEDAAPNVSPVPPTDLRKLWVGEPHQADGVTRLAFTLSLGGGGVLPPSSQWYVIWNRPVADTSFDRNYVAMKTDAAGIASFEFGKVAPPSAIPPPPDDPGGANLPTRLGAASGAYDPLTGIVTITVANSDVDGVAAGSILGQLQARSFLARPDGGPLTQLQSTDFGPITLYRMVGNC